MRTTSKNKTTKTLSKKNKKDVIVFNDNFFNNKNNINNIIDINSVPTSKVSQKRKQIKDNVNNLNNDKLNINNANAKEEINDLKNIELIKKLLSVLENIFETEKQKQKSITSKNINDIVSIDFVGFCPSCGDAILTPMLLNINAPNKKVISLPTNLCKKCGCIATSSKLLNEFIGNILRSIGADFSPL